jgi:hypothetical protein
MRRDRIEGLYRCGNRDIKVNLVRRWIAKTLHMGTVEGTACDEGERK